MVRDPQVAFNERPERARSVEPDPFVRLIPMTVTFGNLRVRLDSSSGIEPINNSPRARDAGMPHAVYFDSAF